MQCRRWRSAGTNSVRLLSSSQKSAAMVCSITCQESQHQQLHPGSDVKAGNNPDSTTQCASIECLHQQLHPGSELWLVTTSPQTTLCAAIKCLLRTWSVDDSMLHC